MSYYTGVGSRKTPDDVLKLSKFGERVRITPSEYFNIYDDIYTSKILPCVAFSVDQRTGIEHISIMSAFYDISTLIIINKCIDQFNQLKALNETKTM